MRLDVLARCIYSFSLFFRLGTVPFYISRCPTSDDDSCFWLSVLSSCVGFHGHEKFLPKADAITVSSLFFFNQITAAPFYTIHCIFHTLLLWRFLILALLTDKYRVRKCVVFVFLPYNLAWETQRMIFAWVLVAGAMNLANQGGDPPNGLLFVNFNQDCS